MKNLIVIYLFILLLTPAAFAHGGEDHGDEKKPAAVTTAGALPTRKAERSINTESGQFQFHLTQIPADARNGEEVQFEVRIVELVEGGFEGGQLPVDDAKVSGQLKTVTGNPVSASEPAHKESEAGVYGIHHTFKNSGDYKLFFDVTTSDGRKVSVDFPVAIATAPVRYTPFVLDLILLIAIITVIGTRYHSISQSAGYRSALIRTLPVAAAALLVFVLTAMAIHYYLPAIEPRDLSATDRAAPAGAPLTGSNRVFVPKESQVVFGIRTAEVKQEKIVSGVTVTGVIKVRPQFKAEVVPLVAGRSRAVGNITVGTFVKQGQTLAVVEQILSASEAAGLEATRTELKAKTAEMQAQAQQAVTRRNAAQIELTRAKSLYEAGAAPLKRVQEAETQLRLAEQEVAAAQQLRNISEVGEQRVNPIKTFPITAPISGVIAESHFTPGEPVEEGKRLFTIMNLDRVWIEAQVFEKDLATITTAQRATFKVAAFPNTVFQIGGGSDNRLITIGASVDPEKRTVPVVYEVANVAGKLRDGMMAEITIDTTGEQAVISVPKTALLDEQGRKYVFVFNGGEQFEKRLVTVGSAGQTDVQILSGLKPGERVVVEGIYQLRSTAPGAST